MARSALGYVVAYVVLLLPTYLLPWFGSNSAVLVASGWTVPFVIHVIFLGLIIWLAHARGQHVGVPWLVGLAVLAAVFDLLPGLNWIPLAPSILHLAAILCGVALGSSAEAEPRLR